MGAEPPTPPYGVLHYHQFRRHRPMTEAYAVFTTGNDYYDRPELFGLFATTEKAEAAAAALRERMDEFEPDEHLYSEVTVAYVPIR